MFNIRTKRRLRWLLILAPALLLVLYFGFSGRASRSSDQLKPSLVYPTEPELGPVLGLELINTLKQDDVRVADYIRERHLIQPSDLPYSLSSSGSFQNSYSSYVDSVFNYKKNGTFIEVGAYDGEVASNSLYFEKIGWTGLLIECNPLLLPKLMAKNRRAWIANVCLSTTKYPGMVNFTTPVGWPASAKLGEPLNETMMKHYGIDWMANKTWLEYQLPSFPLYSIIKATRLKEIDFLTLDVEGAEIDVLTHFPFDDIKIKVIIAEIHTFPQKDRKELVRFMTGKGYNMAADMGNDYAFLLKEAFPHVKR